MTTAAAYPATMTELRGESPHSSIWPNYAGSTHMSYRLNSAMDPVFPNPAAPTQPGRPRSDQASVDHSGYSYGRYSQDDPDAYERHAQAGLQSQSSYSNLKRSFSQAETPGYQEIVQDLRDDGSRMTVNQDHKMLAFRRSPDKHTIVDQHGRIHQLELSAQLHGMFFLSEMPVNPTEGAPLQPELTCYRRNLFQISGSLVTPRGPMSVVTETGESVLVNSMEVTISAIESVDGNPVRLIVIPWKTPPPNTPEIIQGPDQEPASLPLIPFQDESAEADGEFAVYPIGWRRLQFRIATANNGRRKELQQHFVLHLKVYGTLANNSKVVLSESITAPIVVRGRSPRNFQARKEIPLLGSSAGSRGQALVESGMGVVAGPLNVKQQEAKARGVDVSLPRTAFTFSPQKASASQLNSIRSNSYPAWSPQSNAPLPEVPSSSPGNYPATTLGSESYPKVPLSGAAGFASEPQELPLQSSIQPPVPLSLVSNDHQQPPMRSPYTYVQPGTASSQLPATTNHSGGADPALNVPRYVDHPRPVKSPRQHPAHQSVHGTSSSANHDATAEYRYGSYAQINNHSSEVTQPGYQSSAAAQNPGPPREYYPSSGTWPTTAGEHNPSVGYTSGDVRSYSFSHDQYKSGIPAAPVKQEPGQPAHPSAYGGAQRGSFDAMNNYSWGGS